jgi:N-acetylglucosaminyldiphosphoundecaprenol N-acetyl-beta-D-mannosaminyltransferase
MYAHKGMVCGVMIGVGAGFAYHAGKIRRAPQWMQRIGMEWFYRLLQDPKRLAGRYFKTNLKFLWKVWREK